MGEEFCQDLLRFRQDWGGGGCHMPIPCSQVRIKALERPFYLVYKHH